MHIQYISLNRSGWQPVGGDWRKTKGIVWYLDTALNTSESQRYEPVFCGFCAQRIFVHIERRVKLYRSVLPNCQSESVEPNITLPFLSLRQTTWDEFGSSHHVIASVIGSYILGYSYLMFQAPCFKSETDKRMLLLGRLVVSLQIKLPAVCNVATEIFNKVKRVIKMRVIHPCREKFN